MLDSMRANPPSIKQALKNIPIAPLPWPQDIRQYLKPIFITSPTTKTPGPDFLSALPVELLLCIADFLPLEDIYCVSLCNYRLLAIFTNRKKHQDLERNARLSFLHRLEHDHPRYLACYDCSILHNLNGISERFEIAHPTHTFPYPPRVDCVRASEHHSRLHFSHLHLAMRRFYCGPQYGISTGALSFTEVRDDFCWGDRVARPTTLFSIEAQICPKPPSLLLRIQDIMSTRSIASTAQDEYYCDVEQEYFATFRVCKHHSEGFWMQYITHDAYPAHFHSNCGSCNTDIDIELFKNRPDGHVTIVMTRWINLGPGLSSDDPRWSVNAGERSWDEPEVFKLDSKYMELSPRHTFEALTDTSLGNFTYRNLSYLENRRYENVMVPIPRSEPPSWGLWNGAAVL
ncbi:hypothetical protein N7517_005638 [Penicillium concentricum]|uniref:F-box domain-containing protein n=1 Tax=Penicillium concentricum TaxID=293559 RepID=A0A9W9V9D8_9EURO|nr:uncharacterized protein N7517_005638 [Penicillium concentricum]KAJ5373632.1 hypothetical protein N7517_005638 [Penicillium concentricum]